MIFAIPEDIRMSWAALVEDLQRCAHTQGGKEMEFSIIVRKGIVCEVLEPVYRGREPRGSVIGDSKSWYNVVRRLQSIGVGSIQDCVIDMRIDLDLNDNPTAWREPDVRKIEPKNGR